MNQLEERPTAGLEKFLDVSERVGTAKSETDVVGRMKDLLYRPEKAWREIAQEEGGLVEAFLPYTLLTVLAPAVIGGSMLLIFGVGMFKVLFGAGVQYLYAVLGMLITGKLIEFVAPTFGGRRSWVLSCRLLVYSATPAALASVLQPIPVIGLIALGLGLFRSVKLFIQGFKILLKKA